MNARQKIAVDLIFLAIQQGRKDRQSLQATSIQLSDFLLIIYSQIHYFPLLIYLITFKKTFNNSFSCVIFYDQYFTSLNVFYMTFFRIMTNTIQSENLISV